MKVKVITLNIEAREDGGLRIRSPELPGLALAGKPEEVMRCVLPAIEALLEHQGSPGVLYD
jgi:hypothetical protein